MKLCIFKVDYRYRSAVDMFFDEDHRVCYVEADECVRPRELEDKLYMKIAGFAGLNFFKPLDVLKLS